jgi:hypothetical protein
MILIEKGAATDISYYNDKTALDHAIRGGNIKLVQELMKRKVKLGYRIETADSARCFVDAGGIITEEVINKAVKDPEIIKILTTAYLAKKN